MQKFILTIFFKDSNLNTGKFLEPRSLLLQNKKKSFFLCPDFLFVFQKWRRTPLQSKLQKKFRKKDFD